jgi:MFS family permease
MRTYRQCLSAPYATYLLVSNLVGRLPNGMGVFAIALFLRSESVSYQLVGVFTALYGLVAAVGGPMLGRMIDQHGQPFVLTASALGSAFGFVLLAVAEVQHIPIVVTAVLFAGLFTPPLEPCLRALWPSILTGKSTVAAAYALDAALQEVIFVAAPLLVVALVHLFSPGTTLWVTGLVAVMGTLAFVAAPPVRRWRTEPRIADWSGPLRAKGLRILLLSLLSVGAAIGILNIVAVAYAERVGQTSLSGILLGAHALGALIGGLTYGARALLGEARGRITWLLGALAVCYWPLVIVGPPPVMIVLMLGSGLFLGPVLACSFTIVGDIAPRGTVTEAFAWIVATFLIGSAFGSALAGSMLEQLGMQAAFLLPGLAGSSALAVVLASPLFRRPVAPLHAHEPTG